jgi:hypothetical protein
MNASCSGSVSSNESGSYSIPRARKTVSRLSSVVVPERTQIVVPSMSASCWKSLSAFTIIAWPS